MFQSIKTLLLGAEERAHQDLRDRYSVELIDQKIREAEQSLKAAKYTLASIIQRERAESRQINVLQVRATDLEKRGREALAKEREDLAREAAQAVADIENELVSRRDTRARLETRIFQLRQSLDLATRRIIDLRQGAISARAIRSEQKMQTRLVQAGGMSALDDAEELIGRVLQQDDPFERSQILNEIERGLDHADLPERMANAGIGETSKVTADAVFARLTETKNS